MDGQLASNHTVATLRVISCKKIKNKITSLPSCGNPLLSLDLLLGNGNPPSRLSRLTQQLLYMLFPELGSLCPFLTKCLSETRRCSLLCQALCE